MDNWSEIRTAYQVARLGTVSAAADKLGLHRATVVRHIETLESVLGGKLFQRHARGFTPTEAGQDLMRVAKATEEQFDQLVGRSKGRDAALTGDLVVTSLEHIAPLLMPTLKIFQDENPEIKIRYLTDERVFKLEYGEAHIAIRSGPRPAQPDNIVQPFSTIELGLYASNEYAGQFGIPNCEAELADHRFVGSDPPIASVPSHVWMQKNIPAKNIVFQSGSQKVLQQAILSGTGIGFLSLHQAGIHSGLIEVLPPREEWNIFAWLVTHVDLHRTAKVQAFLKVLKSTQADEQK